MVVRLLGWFGSLWAGKGNEHSTPWERGYQDALDREFVCPFPAGSDAEAEWLKGFQEAEDARAY